MPAHLTIERNHNYIENTFFLHFAIVVSAVNIAPNLKKKKCYKSVKGAPNYIQNLF